MKESLIEDTTELARKLASEVFSTRATKIDKKDTFPWENIRALGEAGFMGLIISEDYGGFGIGRDGFASVVKEISKACASTALIYVSHAIVAKAVELFASDTIKEKWLSKMIKGETLGAFAIHESDSGSNAGAITTRALKEENHYIVKGSKFFITSAGEAGVYLVLAKIVTENGPGGMSTFLIEKDTSGLSFGETEDKMGLTSTSSRQMHFSDCLVAEENLVGREGDGAQVIGKTVVGWGFFGAAAISLGIAKSATECAIKHAKQRTIAGQPIGVHQAVQFMITDMILGSESTEAFLRACANKADLEESTAPMNGFKAKLLASEIAVEVANKAIQVMGAHGYSRDYIVERLFRDARGLTLHFKTSEWIRQDIAKSAMGL